MTLDLDDEDRVEAPKDQITGWVQLILVGGVIIGAVVATNLMNSAAINEAPQTATAELPTVEVFQPRIGTSVVEFRETGVVELRSTVNVVPQVSGRVLAISSDFAGGGAFEEGQTLFEVS